jgi:hypothetical protein
MCVILIVHLEYDVKKVNFKYFGLFEDIPGNRPDMNLPGFRKG